MVQLVLGSDGTGRALTKNLSVPIRDGGIPPLSPLVFRLLIWGEAGDQSSARALGPRT